MNNKSLEYSKNIIKTMQIKNMFGCIAKDKLDQSLILVTDWLYQRSNLSDKACELIIFRYARLIKRIRILYLDYTFYHTFSNLFTSIAALLVTALISVNKFTTDHYSEISWWLSWILALLISIINTLSTFFKWDRKYILLLQIYNKMEQEIWMFISLIGPYASFDEEEVSTHKLKLRIFLARIELANKRLNDNLLDIEENDQDDREMLRRKHYRCHNEVVTEEINQLLETKINKIQQNELNTDLQMIVEKSDTNLEIKDEDIIESQEEIKK